MSGKNWRDGGGDDCAEGHQQDGVKAFAMQFVSGRAFEMEKCDIFKKGYRQRRTDNWAVSWRTASSPIVFPRHRGVVSTRMMVD